MDKAIIIGLINNTALLLALGVLYDTLIRNRREQNHVRKFLTGFFVGAAGIAIMFNPVRFMDGVIFDTRSILLAISGLFFGPVITVTAMVMTGLLRLFQGGAGALTGVSVIIMSGTTGLLWNYCRRKKLHDVTFQELLVFGLTVHVFMLLLMLTLSRETALQVLTTLTIPILVIYTLGTALLGFLMVRRFRYSQTEIRLRDNEQHLRNLIDNTSAGYFHIGNDGNFIDVNRSWLEMHGFESREEVIGKHFSITQIDSDQTKACNNVRDLMAGQTISSAEFSRKRKNGTTGYHTFSAHTVVNNGVPEGIEGFLIDITDQRKAEVLLKEQHELFSTLLETINTPIFYKDTEGRYISCNRAFEDFMRITRDDLKGKTVYDISPHDNAEMYVKADNELLNNPGSQQCEWKLQSGSGSIHDVVMNKATYRDSTGNIAGIVGVITDITDIITLKDELEKANRKLRDTISDMELTNNAINIVNAKLFEANKDLADSEERYRLLFEEMMSGFALHEIILDTRGVPVDYRFIAANNAFEEMTGLRCDNIIGKTIREIMPDVESFWIEKYGHVATTGTPVQFEDYSAPLDRYYEVRSYSPGQGLFAVIIQDITVRKTAEAHIANALKEKEILLRELYHRTKNNMQVIQSMLILQSLNSESDEVKKLVAETDMKIQSMSLVHQMLYQSQNLSSINLKTYISELVRLVMDSTNFPGERVSFELSLAGAEVTVDIAIPCGLVLNELMLNTVKYAFPENMSGTINISLAKEGDLLRMVYSDTGIGVPENFDFRSQKSYGLRSIFSIIERQLQGEVSVEAGSGITYTIRFKISHYATRI